jgi:hypothetical protein
MPEDVRLAFRFAHSVLAHDPQADALRVQIVQRWGEKGLISLGFAITAARIFPTLKYALGHGQSCSRVKLDGATVSVDRQPQVAC